MWPRESGNRDIFAQNRLIEMWSLNGMILYFEFIKVTGAQKRKISPENFLSSDDILPDNAILRQTFLFFFEISFILKVGAKFENKIEIFEVIVHSFKSLGEKVN